MFGCKYIVFNNGDTLPTPITVHGGDVTVVRELDNGWCEAMFKDSRWIFPQSSVSYLEQAEELSADEIKDLGDMYPELAGETAHNAI